MTLQGPHRRSFSERNLRGSTGGMSSNPWFPITKVPMGLQKLTQIRPEGLFGYVVTRPQNVRCFLVACPETTEERTHTHTHLAPIAASVKVSGTSPMTTRCARPSTMAVFPTPGEWMFGETSGMGISYSSETYSTLKYVCMVACLQTIDKHKLAKYRVA